MSTLRIATLLGILILAGPAMAGKPPQRVSGVINLNKATPEELDQLPGVGAKAAARIVAYREKQPFKRIEELVKVKGFGRKRFKKLSPHLAVTGPSTLKLESSQPGGMAGGAQ